jgi:hypothetical protein
VAENRLLECLQRLARLDAEVVDERPSGLAVGLERVRLPVGSVERQHLLCAEALPQRVLGHEDAQLSESLLVPTEGEVAVDPVHQRRQPQLVERCHLVTSARFELQPGESRAAPEGQRLSEALGGRLELAVRDKLLRLPDKNLHAARVEALRLDMQPVSAGCRCDRIGARNAERLAQLRHVDVDRFARGRRRCLPPQVVDQALAGDELVRVQQ